MEEEEEFSSHSCVSWEECVRDICDRGRSPQVIEEKKDQSADGKKEGDHIGLISTS